MKNMGQEIFDELADAVLSFDAEKAVDAAKKAVSLGISPIDIIEKGLSKGLGIVGKKFEDGEFFLMHLVAAAEAARKAISEVVEPELLKRKEERRGLGRVVVGTVAGDIHDIGKSLVAALLTAGGFDVYDIGKDVPAEEFVNKAREVNADIVAASALLSTTVPVQREIVEALKAEGLRDKVKVMVGGAPVTGEWAEEIGADGYAEDAVEAVRKAKQLLGIKE
jgi:corrinoid protein of di/trimethylamine methyltransferase